MPWNIASDRSPVGWRSWSGAPQRRAEGLFLQTHTVSLPKRPLAGALERGRSVGRCHLQAIPALPGWVTLSWWLALRPHFLVSQMGLCLAGGMSVGMVFVPVRGASISGGEALSHRPRGLSSLQGAFSPQQKGRQGLWEGNLAEGRGSSVWFGGQGRLNITSRRGSADQNHSARPSEARDGARV